VAFGRFWSISPGVARLPSDTWLGGNDDLATGFREDFARRKKSENRDLELPGVAQKS